MSSKETAATNQLLTLLESRYAIRVIWALRDGHAQTFRLLQDSVGSITPNTRGGLHHPRLRWLQPHAQRAGSVQAPVGLAGFRGALGRIAIQKEVNHSPARARQGAFFWPCFFLFEKAIHAHDFQRPSI